MGKVGVATVLVFFLPSSYLRKATTYFHKSMNPLLCLEHGLLPKVISYTNTMKHLFCY